LKHQGKRTTLSSDQFGPKSTAEMISDNDSASQVKRYIRLTNLIPEILEMMDEGKIAFSVGVELSYLDDQHQNDVLDACEENENTPSYAQAVRMHKAFNSGELDRDGIDCIMSEEKPNQHLSIKIPLDRIEKIIPYGFDSKKTEDYVVKALEFYHRYLMKQREQAR